MAPAKKRQSGLKDPIDLHAAWDRLKEEIRQSYPIDRAFDDFAPLEKATRRGDTITACCPFHVDRTPSFSVNVKTGVYHCFGAGCDARGDIFHLIRDRRNISFPEAVLLAAHQAGVTIPPEISRDAAAATKVQPAARPQRQAPEILTRPADLKPCDMTPIPDSWPRIESGRWFRVWNNGRRTDLSDRGVKKFRPAMVHRYIDVDGRHLCSILRCEFPDRKIFIPVRAGKVPLSEGFDGLPRVDRLCDGNGDGWIVDGPGRGHARPVYGMENVRDWLSGVPRHILVVEGEKTADAARRLVRDPEWLVLTPMGGGSAAPYADWSGMVRLIRDAGIDMPAIHIWQDADAMLTRSNGEVVDRQDKFCRQIASSLLQVFIDCGFHVEGAHVDRVSPPPDVASGWDLADAEKEGWGSTEVMDYLSQHMVDIDMARLNLVRTSETDAIAPEFGNGGDHGPFDDMPENTGVEDVDMSWFDSAASEQIGDAADSDILSADDMSLPETAEEDPAAASVEGFDTDIPEEAVLTDGDVIEGDYDDIQGARVAHNRYFRCLGYLNTSSYFLSRESGQIFSLTPAAMRSNNLLHLAPKAWWVDNFRGAVDRAGGIGVNWDDALDALIRQTYATGVWEPAYEVGQGARIDQGRVVFNTGDQLIVDGTETIPARDFSGKYVYTISRPFRMPDIDAPFGPDAPEIRQYLDIISSLDWRQDVRELSIMATFGWVMISIICGILDFRPHCWLDGPRGSGKSWIIENLITPALGEYRINVKANSTESGLRNLLHARALPLVFDEAEGEDQKDKTRMADIIKLARHSATKGDSVVAQGMPGGQGQRFFSISSTFFLSSITPQIEASADVTRFAHLKLAGGRDYRYFTDRIEGPARDLLTPEFSDRLIARMILRARDYRKVMALMVEALTGRGLERRIADVYGTFAAGAWLALKDGIPADARDAHDFIVREFDAVPQISDFANAVSSDKDHDRIFHEIVAHEVRFDSRNAGQRTLRMGSLIAVACGRATEADDVVGSDEALGILRDYGFRPGYRGRLAQGDEAPDSLLVHRKAPPIRNILERTPYAKSYADVMHQARDVVTVKDPVRFGGLGPARCISVPLCHFGV